MYLQKAASFSYSNSKMKTFVLAAFIAFAAFGQASAYECSAEMQMMITALGECAGTTENPGKCANETGIVSILKIPHLYHLLTSNI